MAINPNIRIDTPKVFDPAGKPAAKSIEVDIYPSKSDGFAPTVESGINHVKMLVVDNQVLGGFNRSEANSVDAQTIEPAVAKQLQADFTAQMAPTSRPQAETIQTQTGTTVSVGNNGALAEFAPMHPEVADMYYLGMQTGELATGNADMRAFEKANGVAVTRPITAQDVNWDKGADVVSNAQKFVIPVPKFEGEPLIYPEGAKDKDGNSIAGKPVVDWQGAPIGDKGLVFFNPKDQAWQAVKSDGEGVVIMNQVTEAQGKKIMDKIQTLTGQNDPANLTLGQFKEVLSFATSPEVGWEKPDMYNSDRGFISKKMNALETQDTHIPQYGLFRRDDRDVCKALFAEGPGEFEAPTSGGITVKQPIPPEGGVLVRQPDGKVFLYRKIDLEAMEETYTHKNGSPLKCSDLPRHQG